MELDGTSEAEILAQALDLAASIRERAYISGKQQVVAVMTGTIGRLERQRLLFLQQYLEPLPSVVEYAAPHYEGD